MSQIANTPNTATAADDPQAPALVTADQFTTGLRALMAQVPEVPSLSRQERVVLQRNRHATDTEVQAAINVAEASDKVAFAVEKTDDIQQVLEDNNRWKAAENELKAALKKVSDANLIRKKRITAFALQAYGVGTQLARFPENAELVPHVQVLKATRRRKKATPAAPAPAPAPVPASTTPATAPPAPVTPPPQQS
jgi:hypothetical protein